MARLEQSSRISCKVESLKRSFVYSRRSSVQRIGVSSRLLLKLKSGLHLNHVFLAAAVMKDNYCNQSIADSHLIT